MKVHENSNGVRIEDHEVEQDKWDPDEPHEKREKSIGIVRIAFDLGQYRKMYECVDRRDERDGDSRPVSVDFFTKERSREVKEFCHRTDRDKSEEEYADPDDPWHDLNPSDVREIIWVLDSASFGWVDLTDIRRDEDCESDPEDMEDEKYNCLRIVISSVRVHCIESDTVDNRNKGE